MYANDLYGCHGVSDSFDHGRYVLGDDILTNIKCILKNKRADSYIDVCFSVFYITLVLTFIVNFFPVFITKYKLDVFASEIVGEAEIKGSTDISERIKELRKETGLNPAIVWECNYYKGNKIQLDIQADIFMRIIHGTRNLTMEMYITNLMNYLEQKK